MWMQIGAAVLSGLSASSEADKANERTAKQFISGMERNEAVNKTIAESNLLNTIRTGYRTGILNVQRGQSKVAAVRAGYDLGAKALAVLGKAQADAASSGSIGASVDAVKQNIQMKLDEAQGEVNSAWETQQQNFDQSLYETVQSGIDSLRYAEQADYRAPELEDTGMAFLMGAAKSAAGFATQYATANSQLGLGAPMGGGGLTTGDFSRMDRAHSGRNYIN